MKRKYNVANANFNMVPYHPEMSDEMKTAFAEGPHVHFTTADLRIVEIPVAFVKEMGPILSLNTDTNREYDVLFTWCEFRMVFFICSGFVFEDDLIYKGPLKLEYDQSARAEKKFDSLVYEIYGIDKSVAGFDPYVFEKKHYSLKDVGVFGTFNMPEELTTYCRPTILRSSSRSFNMLFYNSERTVRKMAFRLGCEILRRAETSTGEELESSVPAYRAVCRTNSLCLQSSLLFPDCLLLDKEAPRFHSIFSFRYTTMFLSDVSEQFKEVDKYVANFIRRKTGFDLDNSKICVAGSSVLSAVLSYTNQESFPPNDVDLFVHPENVQQLTDLPLEQYKLRTVLRGQITQTTFDNQRNVFEPVVELRGHNQTIQIIPTTNGSVDSMIQRFDIAPCQIAFYRGRTILTAAAYFAIKKRKFYPSEKTKPCRTVKYLDRRFEPIDPEHLNLHLVENGLLTAERDYEMHACNRFWFNKWFQKMFYEKKNKN